MEVLVESEEFTLNTSQRVLCREEKLSPEPIRAF